MTRVRARPALANFTRHMEERLRDNDHKGKRGWYGWSRQTLTRMLIEEVLELSEAKNNDQRKRECCDIANFAMMIFDNIDG